jgi:predicted ATPase
MDGFIQQNGTIILDEPEIHLHPEWQVFFAEIIVLMQKEFGLHVLLNTHSPYFLRAIEVYSNKYKIADRCNYYSADNKGDYAEITNVNKSIAKIYAKLSSPFQKLEDERWSDD